MNGPVSAAMEQEVLGELRRKGIVVWLDKDGAFTQFVDGLAAKHAQGAFPFPVLGFRGSFLDLLFKLDPYGNDLDSQPLLVHMPGFSELSIRATPLLELYDAGSRYRKALDSLIRETATARVAPADVDAFVASGPSLEAADSWLSEAALGAAVSESNFRPIDLAEALANPASSHLNKADNLGPLLAYVHRLTGMDEAWTRYYPSAQRSTFDGLVHQLGAWILAVEYVHDLRRPPHDPNLLPLKSLSAPLVKACCDLAARIRRDNADAYERMANEVEEFFKTELAAMTPEDLGQIDTFKEEEVRVLRGAVEALRSQQWAKAKDWCTARAGDKSFWIQRDRERRWSWTLVEEAAELGAALARHPRPLAGARSLDDAAQRYAAGAFEVDRAHRRFEQRRLALLTSTLPEYASLRELVTELRQAHRDWADALCADFATLCTDGGFLPNPELRQRNLFEQVVHPLTQGAEKGEKVAVFLIDAFRYEMATELVEELSGTGTVVDLKPRLAELPSITAVGMNVLAPVAKGERLAVAGAFGGFKTGEYTVRSPADRARAMGMRSVGKRALELPLTDVCDATTEKLTSQVRAHALIVVHSKEIDDAGEANVGLPTFESTLRQIKAAWHHLQLAGVKNFVFTADHGFLLQDETTQIKAYDDKSGRSRRHILDAHPRAEAGMVNVSVSSLGYDGVDGFLLFRTDTAMFASGNAGATFAHGGNSPQERVIPVLTVTRKRAEQGGYSEYAVEVQTQDDVLGSHRLKVRLCFAKQTTTSLGFAAPRKVDISLRVAGRDDIRVVFKHVTTPGELRTGRIQLPVTEAWTEVFFALEGPTDDLARVEIFHPDSVERVQSAVPDQWYSVLGTTALPPKMTKASTIPPPPEQERAPRSEGWAGAIADEGARKMFLHIEKHGSITEAEAAKLLGSPRAFRKFSLELETHLPKLPFRIRIDTAGDGKRYVREVADD